MGNEKSVGFALLFVLFASVLFFNCMFTYGTVINGGKLKFISKSCQQRKAPLMSGAVEFGVVSD